MFAQLTMSFTMLYSWPSIESLYHCPRTKQIHVVRKVATIYVGLVWRKIYTSKLEDVTIIHSATASHALSHTCLVSLLFMAFLYSTLLIRRILYLLVSFPFLTTCTCIGDIKSNMYLWPQTLCHLLHVYFTTKVHSVQSLIVRGPSISYRKNST